MPPTSLQITGRPWKNASWITSGEFSHQIDGTQHPVQVGHQLRQLGVVVGTDGR